MTDEQPSERVVLQRVRNRIIEYLAEFDVLTERYGPFEVVNQWGDWVDDERLSRYVGPVLTDEELEPWGEDYTLLQDEDLLVVATSAEAAPWFNLVELDDGIQVYVEGPRSVDFRVVQGEQELQCGHRRNEGPQIN
jgi:hypothetical protein